MIVALLATIQSFSSPSRRSDRARIVKYIPTGTPGPSVAITTNTASAAACCPDGMPVCAIAAAAPTTSSRFLGLTADSATPVATERPGVKRSIVCIHFGSGGRSPPCGREQQQSEQDREPADPVGRRPSLARVGAARDQQDHGSDDREAGDPTKHERRAGGGRARCSEHQDDGDDRDRAERYANRER